MQRIAIPGAAIASLLFFVDTALAATSAEAQYGGVDTWNSTNALGHMSEPASGASSGGGLSTMMLALLFLTGIAALAALYAVGRTRRLEAKPELAHPRAENVNGEEEAVTARSEFGEQP